MKHTLSLALIALALSAPLARAQEAGAPVVVAGPDAIAWMDAPAFLDPGARIAVVLGDPSTAGEFTIRLQLPADYQIRPHTHPTIENVTILTGSLHVAMGETMDTSAGATLATGGFASIPAESPHYAWTTEPVELQIHGTGPFALNYVNPDDAPKATAR